MKINENECDAIGKIKLPECLNRYGLETMRSSTFVSDMKTPENKNVKIYIYVYTHFL